MLVTRIISISHSVFYSKREFIITTTVNLSSLNALNLVLSNILLFVKGLKHSGCLVNHLPNNKFFDVTKLKAFADYKLNVARMIIFLFDRAEYTVGKGRNAGYQHFLLFLQCFPKPRRYNSGICGKEWRVKPFSYSKFQDLPSDRTGCCFLAEDNLGKHCLSGDISYNKEFLS